MLMRYILLKQSLSKCIKQMTSFIRQYSKVSKKKGYGIFEVGIRMPKV